VRSYAKVLLDYCRPLNARSIASLMSPSARLRVRKVKQPVAPVVETVAVEVTQQPAPGVIAVTEVEETEVGKAS
jgi:hypothetical protein